MTTPPSTTGPLGQPRGIGFGIIIFIITFGIYGIYWAFKTGEEIKQHSGIGLGGILSLIVWLVIGIVMFFEFPSEIGKMYKADGREAPVTGWTGLWILLPLAGGIVWFVKIQGALNRYWESKAGTAPEAAAVPAT
jgi:amino acid transporter